MKTTMQRCFRVDPGAETVTLQFAGEIGRDLLICRAVDSESQADTILIEDVWEDPEVTGEKNRDSQDHMNGRCNK